MEHRAGDPVEYVAHEVVIHRQGGMGQKSLGFKVAGGIDQNHLVSPQSFPDKGIYVTALSPGGAGEEAGLMLHDKILQVNGHDMTMVTHKKAVHHLTSKSVLQLFVHRR